MKQDPNGDARAQGGIDLADHPEVPQLLVLGVTRPVRRRGLVERRRYFAAGLKGRHKEATRFEDHTALRSSYKIEQLEDGRVVAGEVALRNALNEVLRDDYVEDCQRGVNRWNKSIAEAGFDVELTPAEPPLPPPHRQLRRRPHRPRRQPARRGRVEAPPGRVAAQRSRRDLHQEPDAAGGRARQDRQLDRSAPPRHQRAAVRVRVRAPGLRLWTQRGVPDGAPVRAGACVSVTCSACDTVSYSAMGAVPRAAAFVSVTCGALVSVTCGALVSVTCGEEPWRVPAPGHDLTRGACRHAGRLPRAARPPPPATAQNQCRSPGLGRREPAASGGLAFSKARAKAGVCGAGWVRFGAGSRRVA